jgi:uncharacterized protein with GYD domain
VRQAILACVDFDVTPDCSARYFEARTIAVRYFAAQMNFQKSVNREEKMPRFITYASYSHAGVKGLVEKPSDRSAVIKELVEKSGGKLIDLYMTTGQNDVVLITEVPDGTDAVALGMAVAASGSVSKVETVRAWTASEFKGIAEKASKMTGAYKPPGK